MKKQLLISFWVLLAIFLTGTTSVKAASFELDQNKFFLQTSSGKQLTETVLVKNSSDQPIVVSATWHGYSNYPEHSLDFALISNNLLEIQPQGSGNFEISFTSPANIKPGDYYGSLEVTSGNETKSVSFTLRNLGKLEENIQLEAISMEKNKLKILLKNNGNITTKISGKVIVTDFFGSVVLGKNIDQFDLLALNKQELTFVVNTWVPGPYQVRIESIFGLKNTNQTQVNDIWLYPNIYWLVILGVLVSLGSGIVLLLKRRYVNKLLLK